MKRLALIFILTALCFSAFAKDNYAIKVISADRMDVNGSTVSLDGNVELEISTDSEGNEKKTRKLSAQSVVFNLDEKLLQATGSVYMQEGKDSEFTGESISLNWETLDIVVFNGGSFSDRSNAQGTSVKLSTSGKRVSYEGETDSVFFENGVVATRTEDPYWSIRAKEIGMANSDLFFKNATIRMGRVPVMWFPLFFYPGARLAINPAIGMSNEKGMFINTTYELYGIYPAIGETGSSDSNEDNAAGAFLALLKDSDDSAQIRDGLTYRKLKPDEKLSPVEDWARKTSSYFALFADAFEKLGVSLGYSTKNRTLDSSLVFDSDGVVAYRKDPVLDYYNKFRYAFDFDFKMKVDKSNIALTVPVYSDPYVKQDFLNRNTVFGLDSVFGVEQFFPSKYSDVTEYDIKLDSSSYHMIGKNRFNINNVNANIKYKWNNLTNLYEVTQASFPYISVSTGGDIFNISKSSEKTLGFSSQLAEEFSQQYKALDLTDVNEADYSDVGDVKPLNGPDIKETETETSSLKMSFSYSQNLDNRYENEFKHTSLNTNIYTALNLSGNYKNLFSFSESLRPDYSATFAEGTFDTTKLKVTSSFSASIPVAGLTYSLSRNVYVRDNKDGETDWKFGKWDKSDISSHSLSFAKTYGPFSFSVRQTLHPMTETLSPSVSFSKDGFSVSYNTFYNMFGDTFLDQTRSNLNLGFSKTGFSFSFSNSLDHKQKDLKGYSGSQALTFYLFKQKLKFSESMTLGKDFKISALSFSSYYKNLNASINFTGEDCEKESFKINYSYTLKPFYTWKNRIGIESRMNTGLVYNFINSYNSSFFIDFDMNFAINKFIDLRMSIKSVNNTLYNYLDENKNFSFKEMYKDLVRSFDFFGNGRKKTNFKLSSLNLSVIHYMEDWNLTMSAGQSVQTNSKGKKEFKPEVSVMIQWNAIPELKVKSKWDSENKWSEY